MNIIILKKRTLKELHQILKDKKMIRNKKRYVSMVSGREYESYYTNSIYRHVESYFQDAESVWSRRMNVIYYTATPLTANLADSMVAQPVTLDAEQTTLLEEID